jgi:hypothetical protein
VTGDEVYVRCGVNAAYAVIPVCISRAVDRKLFMRLRIGGCIVCVCVCACARAYAILKILFVLLYS